MLQDTTINDKNTTKVIAKLHQVYFKVKIAKKCESIHFLSNSTRLVLQLTIAMTDFLRHYWSDIFSTYIFKKLRAVSTPGGVSHPFSPYYTQFLMFD